MVLMDLNLGRPQIHGNCKYVVEQQVLSLEMDGLQVGRFSQVLKCLLQ